jgi:N-methylhydantoinase A
MSLLAVDVGGTFTDVLAADATGGYSIRKVLSTSPTFADGIVFGAEEACRAAGLDLRSVRRITHATTVATNALLERSGAKCGLVTTEGFRDVLEIGRLRIPRLYDLFYEKPAPLVRRRHRVGVRERVSASGDVLEPLDEARAFGEVEKLVAAGVEAIAICLINSYVNPIHEEKLAEGIRRAYPELYVSASSEVDPAMREFERTSTTVANAYVLPVVNRYLRDMTERFARLGSTAPIFLMQSNGGLQTLRRALRFPARAIESGPAAGVVSAVNVAKRRRLTAALTFDVGGTTAKAAFIEDARPLMTSMLEVGGEISLTTRLTGAGGYPVRVPSVDIAEVGAGGGSIAWVDGGGALKVGPESAGANPGPAAYQRGGSRPTLTDANVVLGYISGSLAGGAVVIDRDRATKAIAEHVGRPLGLSPTEAAYGIYRIANSVMLGVLRAVSVERGRATAGATLIAFGGLGPVHASEIARSLGIQSVLVPAAPGVFSARGLLTAPIQSDMLRTVFRPLSSLRDEDLRCWISNLVASVQRELALDGLPEQQSIIRPVAELRYKGQAADLTVELNGRADIRLLRELFEAEHRRNFGHASEGQEVVLVNLRLEGRIDHHADSGSLRTPSPPQLTSARREVHAVYHGDEWGTLETPVITRSDLDTTPAPGPLIIAEYDSTTLVPPDALVRREDGDILLTLR